ncbi:LysR family transcriptional regulator [Wenxinia saemankumensis]|uniref:DNA-binding transcriptional regulator, LysR family n=1 Tax=Wenxinia saemankumensis TaxID=1447782 RepID=A0A1M6APM3_9RHOB|nr:LysR family transcriptional regulator [Wenxinia saemankumensis]SHI38381.1 DNA-binding transcriptional regulator, LysR family [Wenxinia saemankumensis]
MNLAGFDLNLLKVLDALLREGSTVRAGQRVGLSQPAVSAALGRLRHALADPLFVRAGQRLQPTEVARALAPQVRAALEAAERVLAGTELLDPARLERTFHLCGADYVSEIVLPPVLRRLSVEAPGVRTTIVDEIFEHSLDRMREEEIDVLVVPRFPFPDDLESRVAFTSRFVVASRPGHPALARAGLAPGDTLPLDLFCEIPQVRFGFDRGAIARLGNEDAELERLGRRRRIVATAPGFSPLTAMVAGTDCLAVLPELIGLREAALGRIDLWGAPIPLHPLDLCLVWHRRHNEASAHRWFRDLVAEEAAAAHALPAGTAAPHPMRSDPLGA